MPFVVLGLSHHSAPVAVRERFAFAESMIQPVLGRLRAAGLAEEGVLLSTCNRVELYVATTQVGAQAGSALREFLVKEREYPLFEPNHLYVHQEQAAVEHLFRVASGLDSLVLGETEILGQLKRAYDLALRDGFTGKALNKAFQKAFSVAKQIRTDTQIQRGSTSVGSVAVELAEKVFDTLKRCEVMVIGAGDTSEKTARSLQSRGARSILVSNRSYDRAAALASELGGRAIHFDQWESEFARIDIVISSTSAPHYVLDVPKLERLLRVRPSRPLLLIDLAVPRDIDPAVERIENVYLYNVDDLQAIADESIRQRRDEIARCDEIIRERAQALLASGNVPRPGEAGPSPGLSSPERAH
jgi:glutamyl-tRNA reductase